MNQVPRSELVRYFSGILAEWYEREHYRNGDASALVENLEAAGFVVYEEDS